MPADHRTACCSFELPILTLPAFQETNGFAPPSTWGQRHLPVEAYGGAFAAGRAYAGLNEIRRRLPSGRAVVCSHGDTVPALAAFLNALHDLRIPEPPFRPIWYTLRFDGERLDAVLHDPPVRFPNPAA